MLLERRYRPIMLVRQAFGRIDRCVHLVLGVNECGLVDVWEDFRFFFRTDGCNNHVDSHHVFVAPDDRVVHAKILDLLLQCRFEEALVLAALAALVVDACQGWNPT